MINEMITACQISQLYKLGHRYLKENFSDTELGSNAAYLFFLLNDRTARQEDLVNNFSIDRATANRVVNRLIELGYITREKDAEDRRAYRFILTEKALKAEEEIRKVLNDWNEILTGGLKEKERVHLQGYLNKITDNANKCFSK